MSAQSKSITVSRLFTVFPAVLFCVICICQAGEDDVQFKKNPYVQNITPTSAVIMWEFSKPAEAVLAVENRKMPCPESRLHEIGVTGLEPGTVYTYSVNGVLSGRFRTFPAERNAAVKFVIYGDTRSAPRSHARVVSAIKNSQPLFIVHSGDFVSRGTAAGQWDEQYFAPLQNIIGNVPVFTAVGNHERLSPLYHAYFSQPGNERYYSFDAGCVHVVVLDSMIRDLDGIRKQSEWLEKDLAANTASWTFAVLHHLPLSRRAAGLSMIELNEYVPVLFKYGVQFVFAGHDHYYKRTEPFVHEGSALTFIISAGGGAPLRKLKAKEKEEWEAAAHSVYHFCSIDAAPDAVSIKAVDTKGVCIDNLSLTKKDYHAYVQKGREFAAVIPQRRELLKRIYLDDYDEINETVSFTFASDPKPGKTVSVRMTALSNPFDEALRFRLTWKTDKTSWKISPENADLTVHPGKSASVQFKAVIGDKTEPFPTVSYEAVFSGKKKGRGTIRISGRNSAY